MRTAFEKDGLKRAGASGLVSQLAAAVTRSLRGLLFGLTPLAPGSFVGVAALFAFVATLAALLPAHRAIGALRNQ